MIHRFGTVELDVTAGALRKDGQNVVLKPRPLALLTYLMHQRGRVVTKEEVVAEVWGTAAISDAAISTAIRDIRRALNAKDGSSDVIRTHYGKGFEFIATVEEVSEPTLTAQKSSIAGGYPRSLAVLPFDNLTSEPEIGHLCNLMAGDIVVQMARFRDMRVLPSWVTFNLRNLDAAVRDIGIQAGADYILDGSIGGWGGAFRVNAQLLHSASEEIVWAEQFELSPDPLADNRDTVIASICSSVVAMQAVHELLLAKAKPVDELDAYECFLRGRALVDTFDVPSQSEAIALLERSIRLDPEFADAFAVLSYSINIQNHNPEAYTAGAQVNRYTAQRLWALETAKQAVALDPRLPSGWVALARTQFGLGELDDAIDAARKALSLNPNLSRAEILLGMSLMQLDRAEEALNAFDRAFAASPQDSYRWIVRGCRSIAMFLLERYNEAIDESRQAQLDPNANYLAFIGEVCALSDLGRNEEARRALQRGMKTDPEFSISLVRHDLALPVQSVRERIIDGLTRGGIGA